VVNIQYQTAAYGMRPTINLLPLTWRRRSAPAVVTTFHDLRHPYLFPKAGRLRDWANALLVRGSDGLVFTNTEDRARARRLPGRRDIPEAMIPIGSNIDRAPPPDYERARQRAALGAGPEDLLLAYFGLLNPSKGLEDLLLALAALRDAGLAARLIVVGGGAGSSDPANCAEARAFAERLRALDLEGAVLETGFLPPSLVSARLLAADLAVLPYRDGLSLRRGSLMAMLAHGLPLVSTRPIGESPLRDGEEVLLVPPADPPALAAAVRRLAADPTLRAQLGTAAGRRSREFAWDRIAAECLALYAKAIAGRKA
jgi:glycosyltransferase involved in cell wall biosynthesis